MPDTKPDVSNILQGILSNPQALSSIMSVIGNSSQSKASQEEKDSPAEALPAMAKIAPQIQMEKKAIQPKEIALLMALKPFLSSRRCETIDTFVRLFDIANLLRGVK